MNKYIFNSIILILLPLTTPANAYLDPGTGSIILQAILGFIAATIATASFYWNKLKLFLIKLFKKNNNKVE